MKINTNTSKARPESKGQLAATKRIEEMGFNINGVYQYGAKMGEKYSSQDDFGKAYFIANYLETKRVSKSMKIWEKEQKEFHKILAGKDGFKAYYDSLNAKV